MELKEPEIDNRCRACLVCIDKHNKVAVTGFHKDDRPYGKVGEELPGPNCPRLRGTHTFVVNLVPVRGKRQRSPWNEFIGFLCEFPYRLVGKEDTSLQAYPNAKREKELAGTGYAMGIGRFGRLNLRRTSAHDKQSFNSKENSCE